MKTDMTFIWFQSLICVIIHAVTIRPYGLDTHYNACQVETERYQIQPTTYLLLKLGRNVPATITRGVLREEIQILQSVVSI